MSKLSTAEYIEHMRTAPVPCIDVVLFNETWEKVLLFKRRNEPAKGVFFTPGGCIEKDETFINAAKRKMLDELQLPIDARKLIGPFVLEELWPNSSFPDISYHAITIYFGYTITAEEANGIILDKQHDDTQWFDVQDTALHPYITSRIQTILRSKNTTPNA